MVVVADITQSEYHDFDSNNTISKVIEKIANKINVRMESINIKGCQNTNLNKRWPLKFYQDSFFVEHLEKIVIEFPEFDIKVI